MSNGEPLPGFMEINSSQGLKVFPQSFEEEGVYKLKAEIFIYEEDSYFTPEFKVTVYYVPPEIEIK